MCHIGKPDVDVENLLRGTGTVKDLVPGVILLRPDRKSPLKDYTPTLLILLEYGKRHPELLS